MFRYIADGPRADRASGAARRWDCRFRSFLKHERMSLAVQMAADFHQSRD